MEFAAASRTTQRSASDGKVPVRESDPLARLQELQVVLLAETADRFAVRDFFQDSGSFFQDFEYVPLKIGAIFLA